MKKLNLLIGIVSLTLISWTPAKALSGFIDISGAANGDNTSLTLDSAYVIYGTGDFSGLTFYTPVTYVSPLTELSSSPTAESIPDFFQMADGSDTLTFNLTSITDTTPTNNPAVSSFSGVGTITDSGVPGSTTAASFTIGISGYGYNNGEDGYSIGLNTTPEPSTWALLFGGLGLLAYCQLRARRA
jgi:hypothetical protein